MKVMVGDIPPIASSALSAGYSTFDVMRALKIPRERLKDWMLRGFVKPHTPARGKGTKAVFALKDVYGVALFQTLIQAGFKREMASVFVGQFVKEDWAVEVTGGKIGVEETEYIFFRYETQGGEQSVSAFTIGPGSWAIDLMGGRIGHWDPRGRVPFHPFDPRMVLEKDWAKEDWTHVHVINFKKIRAKVDERLGCGS